MACLEEMRKSAGGKCLVLTIHQPRQEVFDYMTRVVVLVKGRVCYDGGRPGLPAIWESNPDVQHIVGPSLERGVSHADLMLDVLDYVQGQGIEAIETHVARMNEAVGADKSDSGGGAIRRGSIKIAKRLERIMDMQLRAGFDEGTMAGQSNTRVRYVAALLFRRRMLTHGKMKYRCPSP